MESPTLFRQITFSSLPLKTVAVLAVNRSHMEVVYMLTCTFGGRQN